MKVKSMKGAILDLNQVMAANEKSVAIGNAKMNARGDVIGPGGKVVKRREQVAQEYHQLNPKAVRKVSLKDAEPDTFMTPAEAVAAAVALGKEQQAAKEAAAAKAEKKRLADND